ncbi:hypothetical protein BTR23_07360 [Alkalihalophilus pseudofirmus]|nr:hypothetical protein BTR23_07360 [Alkalihalophilus pseudofirmus]
MSFFAYSGLIAKFKNLSQFKSIKDFNNNIEKWLADHKQSFTKSELIALKRLVRYCAKYFGVSNAKIQTLVAATHSQNDMGGVSRSTFERMLRKASQIGLLVVKSTTKANGKGKGHNVFIFRRYFFNTTIEVLKKKILKDKDKSCNKRAIKPENINLDAETINLFKTNNIKNNNIYSIQEFNWLNEPSQDQKLIMEYQERQREIRQNNASRQLPLFNWLGELS